MIDINPGFIPRTVKKLALLPSDTNRPTSDKGKGKAKPEPCNEGLRSYFTSKPKSTLSRSNSAPTNRTAVAGKSSGKRTLVDVMDEDAAVKRIRVDQPPAATMAPKFTQSRFFAAGSSRSVSLRSLEGRLADTSPIPGPSHIYDLTGDKENEPDAVGNEILEEPLDPVTQEDGYVSPTPSYFRLDTPDLSSPLRPLKKSTRHAGENFDDFGADIMSSPIATKKAASWPLQQNVVADESPFGDVLVPETPPPFDTMDVPDVFSGPDLRDFLTAESPREADIEDESPSPATIAPLSEPVTPEDTGQPGNADVDMVSDEDWDVSGQDARTRANRTEVIANGWWNKWALSKKPRVLPPKKVPMLTRQETTITPDGRQPGCRSRPGFTQSRVRPPRPCDVSLRTRKSLTFLEEGEGHHNGHPFEAQP
ncbi:hypothetical protein BV22DRAFT_582643 [Leucogyrophana mollusca]|uniref:Uncharacterized protein n=1 Tax=Leucogyrophana mollusca TaxID=85980 RepID=A0ACB8BCK6_9AGAM|nr:hypothetical protein BV22DRAFT_582643 [Leucogyrophana mollusca]